MSLMSDKGSEFQWDAGSLRPGDGHTGMRVGMDQIDEYKGQ